MNDDFLMHMEETALNAWPALRQMMVDQWLLRFSEGYTKRANSINIRFESKRPLTEKLAVCEAIYARQGLPTIFRTPEPFTSQALIDLLEKAKYLPFDLTHVLGRAIDQPIRLPGECIPQEMEVDEWIKLRAELMGTSLSYWDVHRKILSVIVPQKVLIGLFVGGEPVACGMAVVEEDLLGYFSLFVSPQARRFGYGKVTMDALTRWGADRGAVYGYLQVEADNDPALTLYEKMGFKFAYQYRYWQKE